MSYARKDGIVLFTNERRTSDVQPVFKGFVTIGEQEYEVALWGKTKEATGLKYWSGTLQPKSEQRGQVRQDKAVAQVSEGPDDFSQIPF